MGDTSETNTKVLSRELFLGVVALKRLYRKIIICAIRSLFPNPVTYIYVCVPKKIVIVGTRDLIYLKFVATDFSQQEQRQHDRLLKSKNKISSVSPSIKNTSGQP